MFRHALIAGLAAALLAGCSKPDPQYTGAAGSVALSADGSHVLAVDTDNGVLLVASAEDGHLEKTIKVGANPTRVIRGPDGKVFVSLSGERAVAVVDASKWELIQKVGVDVEPHGLSLTADQKSLLVVSGTASDDPSQGTLTAFGASDLKRQWSTRVGEEPRGVTVVGQKAYVTNLRLGRVTVVDLEKQAPTDSVELSGSESPDPDVNPNARQAGAVADATPSPDGQRVYLPHQWMVSGQIGEGGVSGAKVSSSGYGGGSCGGGAIVSAGIATLVTSDSTTRTDPAQGSCGFEDTASDADAPDFPSSQITNGGGAVQGPSAAVVDPTGTWLFVVNRNSDNVVVLPTSRRDGSVSAVPVKVGSGPDGIALTKDGTRAFVYSQFDHSLSVLAAADASGDGVREVRRVKLAQDTLDADAVAGRKLFFTATDPRMTGPNVGISCASCHVEGRDDGHVWNLSDGPRQTPSLAGRKLADTAPFHWAGLFPTMNHFFKETIVSRMGGEGLPAAEGVKLQRFLEAMPAPENPLQNRPDLVDTQARGRQAFAKAQCTQCHDGTAMTDNGLHDVGTLGAKDKLELLRDGVEDRSRSFPQLQAVNTPSLLGLGRTAPYLHTGALSTIRGRLVEAKGTGQTGKSHGDTSQLSSQELADLEQYLMAL